MATGGKKAATPMTQIANLVSGGSGGGGSNYTGSFSSSDYYTACTGQALRTVEAEKMESLFKVNAYPEPFNDKVTVDITSPDDDEIQVLITDIAGRIVDSFNHAPGRFEIGNKLKSGIYFITVTQSKNMQVVKIIKQEW